VAALSMRAIFLACMLPALIACAEEPDVSAAQHLGCAVSYGLQREIALTRAPAASVVAELESRAQHAAAAYRAANDPAAERPEAVLARRLTEYRQGAFHELQVVAEVRSCDALYGHQSAT